MAVYFSSIAHAELYTQYRPDIPKCALDATLKFYREKNTAYDLAVDIGCGSGQTTKALVPFFNNLIGIDSSEAQIGEARKKHPEISFLIANGNHLDMFDNDSIDLITVSNTFHWLDKEKFIAEVYRVLKTNGVLAVHSFGIFETIECNFNKVSVIYNKWFKENFTEQTQIPVTRQLPKKYNELSLPFNECKKFNSKFTLEWNVDQLVGGISALGVYQNLVKQNTLKTTLEQLRKRLTDVLGRNGGDIIQISAPVVTVLGRKSLPCSKTLQSNF